jgi:AraC-like DNA-binding protein
LQDVVACEVRPKAQALAMVFPAALLGCRAPGSGGPGADAAPRYSLRQIARTSPPRTVSEAVAEIAYARLFDRRFDLEGVAGKLRLGTRTLQRRLARDGQGYRTILQHVRDLHARDLLAGTDLPMTEIAWSLGYDDPAHFSRAFRRTADMAPTRFRQIARARG